MNLQSIFAYGNDGLYDTLLQSCSIKDCDWLNPARDPILTFLKAHSNKEE